MNSLTKTKKTKWFDRLPKPVQKCLDYSIVIILIVIVVGIVVIAIGPPKAPPPTNFITDWDGVSQVTVSYDPVPREYIVSYRTCGGASTFVRMKADQIKPKDVFRGNPCPSGGTK